MTKYEQWWSNVDPSKFLSGNTRQSYATVAGMLTEGAVLEVGCGVGNLYKLLKDRDYTGIDVTRSFIEYSKTLYPETSFHVASIFNIPYEDGEFPNSACMSVFEHLPASMVEKAVTELIRVAKSRVIIEFCIPPWIHETVESKTNGVYNNRYSESEILGYIKSTPRFMNVEKVAVPPHHVIYKVELRDSL